MGKCLTCLFFILLAQQIKAQHIAQELEVSWPQLDRKLGVQMLGWLRPLSTGGVDIWHHYSNGSSGMQGYGETSLTHVDDTTTAPHFFPLFKSSGFDSHISSVHFMEYKEGGYLQLFQNSTTLIPVVFEPSKRRMDTIHMDGVMTHSENGLYKNGGFYFLAAEVSYASTPLFLTDSMYLFRLDEQTLVLDTVVRIAYNKRHYGRWSYNMGLLNVDFNANLLTRFYRDTLSSYTLSTGQHLSDIPFTYEKAHLKIHAAEYPKLQHFYYPQNDSLAIQKRYVLNDSIHWQTVRAFFLPAAVHTLRGTAYLSDSTLLLMCTDSNALHQNQAVLYAIDAQNRVKWKQAFHDSVPSWGDCLAVDALDRIYIGGRRKAHLAQNNITTETNYIRAFVKRLDFHGNISMKETRLAKEITLFPNPVSTQLSLKSEKEVGRYVIFSHSGKEILSEGGLDTKFLIINVFSLQPGFYIIHVFLKENMGTPQPLSFLIN